MDTFDHFPVSLYFALSNFQRKIKKVTMCWDNEKEQSNLDRNLYNVETLFRLLWSLK